MDTLVSVFLGVIALAALIQTVFVAGVALAVRRAAAEIDGFAAGYDHKVRPLTTRALALSTGVARASDGAVEQARRMELRISSIADHIGRRVEKAAGGLEETVEHTADALEDQLVPGAARYRGVMGQARAAWKGVREAVSAEEDES